MTDNHLTLKGYFNEEDTKAMADTDFGQQQPPTRILMGPGPSDIHPRVLAALARPTVGHLDPYYLRLMDELQSMLRRVFATQNTVTFAVSGTGSAGMEAAVVNLVEPGDRMVCCVQGVFGQRMTDVARRAGADVTVLERPWGSVVLPEHLKPVLERVRPKVVGVVMAETSTGACQPIPEIVALVHHYDALLIVDTVTALGGMPVLVDSWDVDVAYAGSQKCLSCPPGLAPITFHARAIDSVRRRKRPVQSWYLDVLMLADYWGTDRVYHHTAPVNMTYALHEALRLILEEGLENCFARHRLHHHALKAGLAALGIGYVAQQEYQLPMLNAVYVPQGVDEAGVRRALLDRFGIEIGGGLGQFRGKVWRIGLMGYGARAGNVLLLLAALEQLLPEFGYDRFEPGSAVAEANRVYRTWKVEPKARAAEQRQETQGVTLS
jgi:alanine-glyoxylate transaminase/serine-glyoxylate transaminase/serine-pyruvate transaminase